MKTVGTREFKRRNFEEAVEFTGAFTAHFRSAFRQRRRDLGVSYQQMGRLFRVSWSTVRKWEDGLTVTCQSRNIRKVQRFLRGDYDQQLGGEEIAAQYCGLSADGTGMEVCDCMERAAIFMQLARRRPDLQSRLSEALSGAVNRAAVSLVG